MNKHLSFLLALCLLFLSAPGLFAQRGFTVTGIVTDTEGEPVTGVSVVCDANRQGTITKADGSYSIQASSKTAELVFSFLGLKTQTVRIDGRDRIDIMMENDAETLENAIVVGAYGVKQRREDMVGSAFQVNSNDLQFKPKARVDNLLEGLVPGMTVENTSDSGGSTRAPLAEFLTSG